tara:strand:+ start:2500 stop:3183 length:684 start_codon:yes stop_codon:yes gene_type:complete
MNPEISVVIPAYNESLVLKNTLRKVREHRPHEIIVVDGGSTDRTTSIAEAEGVRVIRSKKGKYAQMNIGAQKATGNILWFLHADSAVGPAGYRSMEDSMAQNGRVGGAFALKIDSQKRSLLFISWVANWRSRILGLAYGDQGIFVRSDIFRKMGGYAKLPICEDLDFFRRMKKEGEVKLLEEEALVSSRRWAEEGTLYTTFRNTLIAGFFLIGIPPRWFSRWYGVIR